MHPDDEPQPLVEVFYFLFCSWDLRLNIYVGTIPKVYGA